MKPKLIVACVWVGDKYPVDYVDHLIEAAFGRLKEPFEFCVLTDKVHDRALHNVCISLAMEGDPRMTIRTVDISGWMAKTGATGWWAKMHLFEPSWRKGARVVYLDLDSAVVGDLGPLAAVEDELAICANFTRIYQTERYGESTWPCRYGSCAMVLNGDRTAAIWRAFSEIPDHYMREAGKLGDQKVVEMLWPEATLLQGVLPRNYFLGYRGLKHHPDGPPKGCAVVVFAGRNKPDNTETTWARQAWAG